MSNYTKIEHGHNAFKDMNYLGSTKTSIDCTGKLAFFTKWFLRLPLKGWPRWLANDLYMWPAAIKCSCAFYNAAHLWADFIWEMTTWSHCHMMKKWNYIHPVWTHDYYFQLICINIVYLLNLLFHLFKWIHMILWLCPNSPTAHWFDSPLVRQPIGPTAHCFDSPLVRQPIGSTTNIWLTTSFAQLNATPNIQRQWHK